MILEQKDKTALINALVGSFLTIDEAVDSGLYEQLVGLAQDAVLEAGLERCEWCDYWDDCLGDTPDGQWLCSDCFDIWLEENEEEEEEEDWDE